MPSPNTPSTIATSTTSTTGITNLRKLNLYLGATPVTNPCVFDKCDNCVQMDGCGWCQSTLMCQLGSSKGPEMGTCMDWRFTSTSGCDVIKGN